MEKRCFKCGKTKPIEEFYAHPEMADGHLGKCKECTKSDVHQQRVDFPEKRSAYEQRRNGQPERRGQRHEYTRRRRDRYPEKERAYRALAYAIFSGKVVRPERCPVCERLVPVQGHHHDYSKPLDVEWMCFRCHRERGHGQVVVVDYHIQPAGAQ